MATDLAQAQQECMSLRQERTEMAAQREQMDAELIERAKREEDAAERHREEVEQSRCELEQVRHELDQIRHEAAESRGDAEQARRSAAEQEDKCTHVAAELAGCQETMAAEQALLKQQIAALEVERTGLQKQISLREAEKSNAPPLQPAATPPVQAAATPPVQAAATPPVPAAATPPVQAAATTTVARSDPVVEPERLEARVQQTQAHVNEGVPGQLRRSSDLHLHNAALRIQSAFRLARLRRRLDAAVAGAFVSAPEFLCRPRCTPEHSFA
jgi:hypothetical protein